MGWSQGLGQLLFGPLVALTGGGGGYAVPLCQDLKGLLLHDPAKDQGPLLRPEGEQSPAQILADIVRIGPGGGRGREELPLPPPDLVDAGGVGQAVQPGLEGRGFEPFPVALGFEKGVLHRVLGLVVVAEDVVAVAEQRLPVPVDGGGEGGLVSGGKGGLKLLFVHGVPPFTVSC